MVSTAAGNKKAFGIDRAANPWSDIPKAEVVWISGANVGECAPITTNYVWQARDNGARIIVVDPRITPLARTCDLFMPVKPGRDIAPVQRHSPINDRKSLDRLRVHPEKYGRVRRCGRPCQRLDTSKDSRSHRHR